MSRMSRMGRVGRAVLGTAPCLVALACSAPAPRPARAPVPVAAGPTTVRFPDGASGRLRSKDLDFPIELRLPSKPEWQVTDGPTWLVARHAATSSELALRTWRAERLVRRTDCAAQARLARTSIPEIHDETVVERRAFGTPADFDTELVVGVEPTAKGLSGYALAIGASVGRCYAAVFTTRVDGSGAEQEVATRLGVAVDQIFASVRLRSVDDRAQRHRLLAMPAGAPPAAPAQP
ncbi:MAG: hypothetical protein ABI627_32380 [Polyangiaceae bacterium]